MSGAASSESSDLRLFDTGVVGEGIIRADRSGSAVLVSVVVIVGVGVNVGVDVDSDGDGDVEH